MTATPSKLLLLDLAGLPPSGPAWLEAAMPFLAGLRAQGAWGLWATPQDQDPQAAWAGFWAGRPPERADGRPGLWPMLQRAGVIVGLLNLPATGPAPEVPSWLAARLEAPEQAARFSYPPGLADDLGEYQAGQLALAACPRFKPHQRDEAFAQWVCLARLVWQEADRLLATAPPALAGLGLQGLGQVCSATT